MLYSTLNTMKSLKNLQILLTGLYSIAAAILMYSIYLMTHSKENKTVSIIGYVLLAVSALFHLWVEKQKKKQKEG